MGNTAHLTRVVAPTINDSNIVESLQDAIDVINKNFITLASVPFLQGVKGDNYHTTVRKIFNNNAVTEDGALLLNSIFKTTGISKGQSVSTVVNNIKKIAGSAVDGNPLDSVVSKVNGSYSYTYTNNNLYFYVLINDAGEEYGEQLGQYYYFIDGRIKNLSDAYYDENETTELSSFVDYSGFYRYIPATNSESAKYEKLDFLPTLYYDTKNNDICWKFNNTETGMSAMGPKGADGKDSNIAVVKVASLSKNVTYGAIEKATSIDDISSSNPSLWSENLDKCLEDGYPAIIVYDTTSAPKAYNFAFGIVKKIDDKWNAIWGAESVINNLLSDLKITTYLKSINNSTSSTVPNYLPIPVGSDSGTSEKYHTLKGDKDKNLVLSGINEANSAKLSGAFILDDYDIVLTTGYTQNNYGEKYIQISQTNPSITLRNGDNITTIDSQKIKLNNSVELDGANKNICATFNNDIVVYAGESQIINDFNTLSTETENEYNVVGMPIGAMIMYYGQANGNENELIHVGNCWLLCNGATLGTDPVYDELKSKIGDTLPNFAGRSPVGTGKVEDETGNLYKFITGQFAGRFTNDILFTADGLETNKENFKYKELQTGKIMSIDEDLTDEPSTQSRSRAKARSRTAGVQTLATGRATTGTITPVASGGNRGVTFTGTTITPATTFSDTTLESFNDLLADTTLDNETLLESLRDLTAEDTVRDAISNISGGVNINNQTPSIAVNFLIKYR